MIKMIELEDNASLQAIGSGEFPQDILDSAPRVIIILTQGWCPDWWAQKMVFKDIEDKGDLNVYYLEYDKKPFRPEFTSFKETTFRNGLIPYLRFYRDGQFERDSNYSGRRVIKKWLES
jgi:hypothetical protein